VNVVIIEGWVFIDGVRICRIVEHEPDVVAFFDKDHRRASERGTDQVEVSLEDLVEMIRTQR